MNEAIEMRVARESFLLVVIAFFSTSLRHFSCNGRLIDDFCTKLDTNHPRHIAKSLIVEINNNIVDLQ